MRKWLRRIRGAIGMGLTWAVGGALVGFGIELVHNIWPNPLGSLIDIWPAALAYPAFLSGVAFSAVLRIAAGRRRFDQLSIPRFAAWGALAGLLVGLVPAAMVGAGLVTLNVPLWPLTAALAGLLMAGSALAAAVSLALARRAEDRALLEASVDVAGVGLTDVEARELLGDAD